VTPATSTTSGGDATLHRASPEVDASSVADRVVLYHRGTKQALVLNPTGTQLWDLLAGGSTSRALAEALLARHPGLAAERAAADTAAFLAELERHQMLSAAR